MSTVSLRSSHVSEGHHNRLAEDVVAARDTAIASVEESAGPVFGAAAAKVVLELLAGGESIPAEQLTDACKSRGIVPHDDRAFGPVYLRLVKAGLIESCGLCARRKGHHTAGGRIWRLAR